MKDFYQLLRIFCVFVILPTNNGKPIADSPNSQDGVCDSLTAQHLNTQIQEELDKYPEVPYPQLELTETFNKLRNDLASALIGEPSPDDACEKAQLALENFEQFMLQYDGTKSMLESLIMKLLKKEANSNLSESDAFEAFRLSLILEDSATIADAITAIRIARKFLKRITNRPVTESPEDDNEEANSDNDGENSETISDKEKAALEELLKHVANVLTKLLEEEGIGEGGTENENMPLMDILTTVADNLISLLQGPTANRELVSTNLVSLINVIKKESLFDEKPIGNEEASLEDLIKMLEKNVIAIIEALTNSTKSGPTVPPDVAAYINKKINKLLESYPKKEGIDLKLHQEFNDKRAHLDESLIQLPATEEAVAEAESALKEFDTFVGQYNVIMNALEKLYKVEKNDGNPIAIKYPVLKCIHELEKSASIGQAIKISRKCEQYYDAEK